jgi:hypothetical protein
MTLERQNGAYWEKVSEKSSLISPFWKEKTEEMLQNND